MLADSGLTWPNVLRTWSGVKAPEGWQQPEITPDRIFIAPPPSDTHQLTAETVRRALAIAVDDTR
jgi:hypothetical protein